MRGLQRRALVSIGSAVSLAALLLLAPATAANADLVRDREYWLADYGIRAAWQQTRGAGVTVAVIDTGIDGTHPDLVGAVSGGTDFSGDGSRTGQEPVGTEDASHGTMVASLLAGRGRGGGIDGSAGIIGVAPEASLLSISIGFGDKARHSDDQIADAVVWAVDHDADVINMSLTRNTPDWPRSWDVAFQYAMDHEVVIVAAAGNRGSGTEAVGAPATMPGVLTVAGLDRAGSASDNASAQGITIGVAAPSEQLVGAVPGTGYVTWSGTSGAAPLVAGVVALVRAAHPDLDAASVINRITSTATDAGARGVDPIYGFGTLHADRAVSAKVAKVQVNPMGDLAEWVRVHRRASADPQPLATIAPPSGARVESATPVPVAPETLPVSAVRGVLVPGALALVFAAAAAVLVTGARRHFGGLRRRE